MFNAIRGQFNDYVQHLPSQIPQVAIKSAVYAFTITAVVVDLVAIKKGLGISKEQLFSVAAVNGVLCAVASLVHGLMMPLFREVFGQREITWYQNMGIIGITVTIVDLLFRKWGNYKDSLGSLITVAIVTNLIFQGGFKNRSTDVPPVYFF